MTEWRTDRITRNSEHGTQKPSAWYALGLKMKRELLFSSDAINFINCQENLPKVGSKMKFKEEIEKPLFHCNYHHKIQFYSVDYWSAFESELYFVFIGYKPVNDKDKRSPRKFSSNTHTDVIFICFRCSTGWILHLTMAPLPLNRCGEL